MRFAGAGLTLPLSYGGAIERGQNSKPSPYEAPKIFVKKRGREKGAKKPQSG